MEKKQHEISHIELSSLLVTLLYDMAVLHTKAEF